MDTPSLEERVQNAVVAKMEQNTDLMDLVTGIFDEVPSEQDYPYIQIGDMVTTDASTYTRSKWDIDMDIKCFDKPAGLGYKTVNRIAGLVYNNLHEQTISVDGDFTIVGCKFVNSNRFRIGDTRQVTITFLVYVEST